MMSKKRSRKPSKRKDADVSNNSSAWKKWFMSKDAGDPPAQADDQVVDLKSRILGGVEGMKSVLAGWNSISEVVLRQEPGVGAALAETVAALYRAEFESESGAERSEPRDDTKDSARLYGRILEKLAQTKCKATSKTARREIHRLKSFKLARELNPTRTGGEEEDVFQTSYDRRLKALVDETPSRYPCMFRRYIADGETILYLPADEPSGDAMDFLILQTGRKGFLEIEGMALPEINRKKFYRSIEEPGMVQDFVTGPLDAGVRILRRSMEQSRLNGHHPDVLCNTFIEIHADRYSGLKHRAKELFPEVDKLEPGETSAKLSHWTLELLAPPVYYEDLETIMETGSTSGILLTGSSYLENRNKLVGKRIIEAFDSDTRNYYAEVILDSALLAALRGVEPGFVKWCIGLADFVKNSPLENSAFLETMSARAALEWERARKREAAEREEQGSGSHLLTGPGNIAPGDQPEAQSNPGGLIIPWK